MKISKFVEQRNKLLMEFENMSDKEILFKLIEISSNQQLFYIPSSPEIARIGLHKMRLQVPSIPKELQERSKKWLIENGYSLSLYEVKKLEEK